MFSYFQDEDYLKIIKKFFDNKRGVYILGDNEPFYTDANKISKYLFNGKMKGNYPGNKIVGISKNKSMPGIVPGHPISTGLNKLFEGSTISAIRSNDQFDPILYGSDPINKTCTDKIIVVAAYNKDGKRALMDTGFTRLLSQFFHATGTSRFVKNAACWLVNEENRTDLKLSSNQINNNL